MEGTNWHVVDDKYNVVIQNRTMTYAMNCAINGLDRLDSGGSLMVCATQGEFSTDKPLYCHVKLVRMSEYQGS